MLPPSPQMGEHPCFNLNELGIWNLGLGTWNFN
jgi:hypothetical protein